MVLTTYGRSSGFCIDPIEKKPLNHFLPGTPILTFGTAGCNLGCKFCQNWDISKARDGEASPSHARAGDRFRRGRRAAPSVALTYNDPVIWAEFAIDIAREARRHGIKSVLVTAGYITEEARGELYADIDAANVDLKAFTEDFYHNFRSPHLQPVLETLEWLQARDQGLGRDDQPDDPRRQRRRARDAAPGRVGRRALGPDVPLHFTAFHPDFR